MAKVKYKCCGKKLIFLLNKSEDGKTLYRVTCSKCGAKTEANTVMKALKKYWGI
tara:strand:+ start:698 stop:859 length:162 start_codon:yes stop_codon:yes gene_type:complete